MAFNTTADIFKHSADLNSRVVKSVRRTPLRLDLYVGTLGCCAEVAVVVVHFTGQIENHEKIHLALFLFLVIPTYLAITHFLVIQLPKPRTSLYSLVSLLFLSFLQIFLFKVIVLDLLSVSMPTKLLSSSN